MGLGLLGAAGWMGGVAAVLAVAAPQRGRPVPSWAPRFVRVATAGLVALVGSGLAQAAVDGGSLTSTASYPVLTLVGVGVLLAVGLVTVSTVDPVGARSPARRPSRAPARVGGPRRVPVPSDVPSPPTSIGTSVAPDRPRSEGASVWWSDG